MAMEVTSLQKLPLPDNAGVPAIDGVLHYKYMPRTGEWGKTDASYAVITPANTPNRKVTCQWSGTGTLTWNRARWEDMPTQYNIVNGLADLEILEWLGASIIQTTGGKDLSDQRIII